MASTVFLGNGAGAVRSGSTRPIGADVRAVADLDGDGRLELIALAGGQPVVLNGKGTRDYGWQIVRPKAATATGDQRINSFGIGGSIEVRTGLHLQRVPIDAPIVHVGLGTASAAEVIRIEWPNGVLQSEFDRPAKTTVAASQRLKGSCPWLFAWNGREMAFVTDLIWRSPLGLRINAQDTADVLTTEDWVKVRGDQLAARDGAYDLRITAELWETHFFDLVSLMAVDHPAGTEVWVDERFAVPTPTLVPIVTGPVQPLAAARDDRGQDVTALVATQDDRHADFAGRGAWQGVTRPHAIELTLPETAPRSGPLWLIARGWVHPTDSSVNVAMGQGKHGAAAGPRARGRGRRRAVPPGARRPRLPVRQGQDGAARSRRRVPRDQHRAAPAAPQHQSRDLLGSDRVGGRPSRCPRRAEGAADAVGGSAVPRLQRGQPDGAGLAGASALRDRRHRAALARSRGLSHALRRRARAARRRRRSLRDHERRRRDRLAHRRGAGAGGRDGARLHPGRRRMGEGR